MSELKYYKLFHRASALTSPQFISVVEFGNGDEVYLKSEADKVIANRDYEIEELKKSIGKLLKVKTEQVMDEVIQRCLIYGEGFVPAEHAMRLVADIHYQKYRRCLAMARWCRITDECIHLESERLGILQNTLFLRYMKKRMWWNKWYKRWLELAKKFKPNKEAK